MEKVLYQKQYHSIPPFFDKNSKALIIGSFPSVKSRETGFYYGHERNRFWKVLSAVLGADEPNTIEEKKKLLTDNGIALWDAVYSCEIRGSSDSSVKNVEYNDLRYVCDNSKVKAVFCTGKLALKLCNDYIKSSGFDVERIGLPSTSPANAAVKTDELVKAYSVIKNYL